MLDGSFRKGTSYAAPQVAGLASYLWLLSTDLRSLPSQVTRQAIVENARNYAGATGVIDAYATVLSLDQAALPDPGTAPIRLAILDVADATGAPGSNGHFDEKDVELFLAKLSAAPGALDYSRYDLNGDGFTGGNGTERFDLDRIGSTQYGAASYTTVKKDIESKSVSFDENNLTDQEILCYYAYSLLYNGDTEKRKDLLGDKCGKGDGDVYLSYIFSYCVYGWDMYKEPYGEMFLILGEEHSYTPLPLPLSHTPWCSPYVEQTTTVHRIDPSQITISSSGWSNRINVPCSSPPPQCPEDGISRVHSNVLSQGSGHIIAGNYTVGISPSATFNLPLRGQDFTAYLGIAYGNNYRQVSCQWRGNLEVPYAQCCYNNGFVQTCYPAGPIEVDIDVPEAAQWYFRSGMNSGDFGVDPPADVSGSVIITIKPKQ